MLRQIAATAWYWEAIVADGAATRVGINNTNPLTDLHIIQNSNADLNNSRGIELQQALEATNGARSLNPSKQFILAIQQQYIWLYWTLLAPAIIIFRMSALKKDIQSLDHVLTRVLH